jgi:murein DD-endopeptidase MepM/ murein hydrolase activator NlpD
MKCGGAVSKGVVLLLAVAPSACASGASPPPATTPAAARQLADHLSGFVWPLPLEATRELTSQYGLRGRRHHDGVDLRSRHGDAIFAAREGVVRFSGSRRGYGLTVILDHGGGVTTLYAHASQLHVQTGEWVESGQVVAAVGATGNATGPHLHFEVAWVGVPIDPVLLLPRLAGR